MSSLAPREQMNLHKIYTALLTADLSVAEDWYTKLLGHGWFEPRDRALPPGKIGLMYQYMERIT